MKLKQIAGLMVMLLAALPAAAEIRIAATTPNMGMLAQTIGGDAVSVTVMAPHDRDAHYLEARPSMMAALRRADLLVSVGAELEIGWLPAAIDGAQNRQVRPGRLGYFEGARHVELLDDGRPADRAHGDVHPQGNPHFYMDPERMARVGHALAERLAQFDERRADMFRANARAFEEAVAQRMVAWRETADGAPGVLDYHKDNVYLSAVLEVPLHGFIEPLPGIPPTARHLRDLVRELSGRQGVIMHRIYQPGDAAQFLGEELGWPVYRLPSNVRPGEGAESYFDIIDQYVRAFAGAGAGSR